MEYLKDVQPINSKSGQTSDRWDAWQRSAANYSLKTESECLCDTANPIRSFSDLFVYTHADIKRGNIPHPALIQKKVPKKQQQQQQQQQMIQQQQRCTSTERKKRSYSEADTKAAFALTRSQPRQQASAVDQSRRKSTGVLPPQQQQMQRVQQAQQHQQQHPQPLQHQQQHQHNQFDPQYYGYPTPHYSPRSTYSPNLSPIEYDALLPTQAQQQFDEWLVSGLDMLNGYNLGGVSGMNNVVDNSNTNTNVNSLGLLCNNGNLTPVSDPVTPTSSYLPTLSPTQSPYKASDGTVQAASAMQQLLYDDSCHFLYNDSNNLNYNIYF